MSTCSTSAAPGAPAAGARPRPSVPPRASRSPPWPWPTGRRRRRRRGSARRPGPPGRRCPPSSGRSGARRWRRRSARRGEELARALTQDQGKPLVAEAYDEVGELAGYFTMAGEDAERLAGEIPPSVSAVPAGAVHPGPARRRRRDQPLELAVHDGRGAVRARARGLATPSSGCPPRPPPPAAPCSPRSSLAEGAPAGVFSFCARAWSGRRRAGKPPRRERGGLHRVGGHRRVGRHPGGGQDPAAGAGRQRADGGAGGRRPRPRRRRRAGSRLPVR